MLGLLRHMEMLCCNYDFASSAVIAWLNASAYVFTPLVGSISNKSPMRNSRHPLVSIFAIITTTFLHGHGHGLVVGTHAARIHRGIQ